MFFFYDFKYYIVNIEKPDEMCSATFVMDELFLHPSIFSIKH